MLSKEGEEHRREIIGRLERRDQELEALAREAETEAAQARQERTALRPALERANLPFPQGDVCPECWVMYGDTRPLHSVPHPHDARQFDRWRCRVCNHVEDRETGL